MEFTPEVSKREDIRELRKKAGEHIWLPYTPIAAHRSPDSMHIFVSADGVRVKDVEGKSYIDAFAGLMYKAVGYGRREIIDAAYAQMLEMTSSPMFDHGTVPGIILAAKLAEITPGNLSRVHYVCGGSEANEVAVKMAKQYQKFAGFGNRYKIIAREGEYHGFTHLTMALGKASRHIYAPFEPLVPGVRHVAHPYCYRCPLGLEYPDCEVRCAKELERTLILEGPESVAAFLTVSVSQETPMAVPPPEYWPTIKSICDKYGVLFIDDEVVCGFGRTGKWFGIENWGVEPDIITVAKAITSGYQPLGAAIASKEISDKFEESQDVLRNVTTFGGLPGSCAAGVANLEIFEKENLVERAASLGPYVSDKLQPLSEHPMVGDIRGIVLMWGIELVKDKKTTEPIHPISDVASIVSKLRELGLITRADNGTIRFVPPLVITKDEIDESIAIFDKGIGQLEDELL